MQKRRRQTRQTRRLSKLSKTRKMRTRKLRTLKMISNNVRNKRNIRHDHKGGDNETVQCCMCENTVNKDEALIPRVCLVKHGINRAHRICRDCWLNLKTGFARENASHECPGCIKGIPLTEYKKMPPVVVDLTED